MARNRITVDASPEAIFAVLADGRAYREWVVGARQIRDVDPDWPAPGARLHHAVGFGPVQVRDTTVVIERREPVLLVLTARARPFMEAHVELRLEPAGPNRTEIHMEERPVSSLARLAWRPVFDALTHVRNDECLRRLKRLVEGRVSPDAR